MFRDARCKVADNTGPEASERCRPEANVQKGQQTCTGAAHRIRSCCRAAAAWTARPGSRPVPAVAGAGTFNLRSQDLCTHICSSDAIIPEVLHIESGGVAEATQVLGWASTLRPCRFDPHSERMLQAQCAQAPAFCHPQRVAPPQGLPPRPSSTPVVRHPAAAACRFVTRLSCFRLPVDHVNRLPRQRAWSAC